MKIAKFILTTIDILVLEFAALFYKNIELQYNSLRRVVSN
jgi:hypothetical protein